MQKPIYSILAVDDKLWFWKDNSLPWKLWKDMNFFKQMTLSTEDEKKINAVIMWRKTWESIPENFRPLLWRLNCILTREKKSSDIENILYFSSLKKSLEALNKIETVENIFIIWWASLYNSILKNSNLRNIFLTRVQWNFDCDIFFDWIPSSFELFKKHEVLEESWIKFNFENWKRKIS